MALKAQPDPYTQILYLTIPPEKDLTDPTVAAGHSWSRALDIVEAQPGFIRLSWGRSPEDKSKVQLHTVRQTLAQHHNFLYSHPWTTFLSLIQPLLTLSSPPPFTRHLQLHHFLPTRPSPTSPSTPVTGSAIYLRCTLAWHEGAWPLWTHIVRHVDGAMGIAGGEIVEEIEGEGKGGYLVYVGWESVEKHEAYHHTEHFAKRRVVLGLGNSGFREYAHMKFEGERTAKGAKL